MKISYQWLKKHIELPESAEVVAERLTKAGLEVESLEVFETHKGGLKGLVIGEVLTCEKHPNADKLSKTTVDLGQGLTVPIVCGAPNVRAGQKVVVATLGATLYPAEGEPFEIKKAKIRGEESQGMICAEDEIGLGKSHEGIMVLDTNLPNGTPAAQYFKIETDYVFEIGLTPNRADAASHLGVARDLKALFQRPLLPLPAKSFAPVTGDKKININIENKEACPRYTGVILKGIKVQDSPEWLKNKLKTIGLSPINNVVDITNYILHDMGQPLHAFDLDKIRGNSVIVKTLPKDTLFITLDGVSRKLHEQDLMICDAEGPMCIAGVFGGRDSGVSTATTSLFLESAYFDPTSVRKTAQRHGLKTDSSFRFERGTDPNMPMYALQQAVALIQELAGGDIASELFDSLPAGIPDSEVKTSYPAICRLIGKDIPAAEIKSILENLSINIKKDNNESLILSVPAFKVDVKREADIVEEVLRIYGYDNIELSPTLGTPFLAKHPENDREKVQQLLSRQLSSQGFNEIITNSLSKPAYADALNMQDSAVEVINKLSEDLGVMRQTLLATGLETLAYNINRRQKNLKVYEFGKTYHKKEKGYEEREMLALYLTGQAQEESWNTLNQPAGYHQLQTTVLSLLEKLNIQASSTELLKDATISHGLRYLIGKQAILSVGQVHEKLCKLADLKQVVWYAEIDLSALTNSYKNRLTYKELNKFPEVRRDLSLVLDRSVSFAQICTLAKRMERKLITDINVFDIYEGAAIGAGKKSYSISFTLEDLEQTLTDKVIDQTMQKLMEAFEKELGAVIRK